MNFKTIYFCTFHLELMSVSSSIVLTLPTKNFSESVLKTFLVIRFCFDTVTNCEVLKAAKISISVRHNALEGKKVRRS